MDHLLERLDALEHQVQERDVPMAQSVEVPVIGGGQGTRACRVIS